MKMIVAVALALVAVASAAPAPGENKPVAILRSEFNQQPDGAYNQAFETENGINVQQTGELKEALDEENKPHTVLVMRGTYSYPGADGTPIQITYYADETGFHAEGDSIPKPSSR